MIDVTSESFHVLVGGWYVNKHWYFHRNIYFGISFVITIFWKLNNKEIFFRYVIKLFLSLILQVLNSPHFWTQDKLINSHGVHPLQVQEQPGLWLHHFRWSPHCPEGSEEDDHEQEKAEGHWWRSTNHQCHHQERLGNLIENHHCM